MKRMLLLCCISSAAFAEIAPMASVDSGGWSDGSAHSASTPEVGRIVENAPNPIGGASVFSFHHYALNRRLFDSTEADIPGNNFGLSLNSAHPLFSESLGGQVLAYYNNGEKPPGTSTSVWDFLMNASGNPLSYTPSVEPNKFCVYFHRRYLLSQIAADASGAVGNLGFVTTPDQWWIQVQEVFDGEGNIGGVVGPDYLIWDHPEAAGETKFARLAREQKAIQTQSNEKWCFAYDVPVVIKLVKGKKVINESDAQWPNEWKPWLDPILKVPSINGYAHFLGANQYPLSPEANTDNVQYLGYEYLSYLLDDAGLDYNGNVVLDQTKFIKENTYKVLSQFWRGFVKFEFDSASSTDPFTKELAEIMSRKELPLSEREALARKSISKMSREYLITEAKNYPINKFKGHLHASFGDIDKVKKIFKSIKANGIKNTLSKIKLRSIKNLAKSAGPEGVLALGFGIWNTVDAIKNPGNPVESLMIYYIPGLMDGMTLSVDTSTVTNNFHLTSKFSELNVKNTDRLPITAFNSHVEKIIEPFGNQACFFSDEEDPNSSFKCLDLDDRTVLSQDYRRFQLPIGHWLKVSLNARTLYLTQSYLRSESSSGLEAIMHDGDTIFELVRQEDTIETYSICGFTEALYQGVAYCTNGTIDVENMDISGARIQSISLNDDSLSSPELEFKDGAKVNLIASVPFFDVFESPVTKVHAYGHEPDSVLLYSGTNYSGRTISLDRSVTSLFDLNFNDVLNSYSVPEGWTVRFYDDVDYKGGYYTRKAGDYSNAEPFPNQISSLRIFKTGEPVLWSHHINFHNGAGYNARIRFINERTNSVIHTSPFLHLGGHYSYEVDYEAGIRVEVQKEHFGWKTFKTFSSKELDAIKQDVQIRSWGSVFNPNASAK